VGSGDGPTDWSTDFAPKPPSCESRTCRCAHGGRTSSTAPSGRAGRRCAPCRLSTVPILDAAPALRPRPPAHADSARAHGSCMAHHTLPRLSVQVVSQSAFAHLFSEFIQYSQARSSTASELERRCGSPARSRAPAPAPADAHGLAEPPPHPPHSPSLAIITAVAARSAARAD
jgi:hypothetical protein